MKEIVLQLAWLVEAQRHLRILNAIGRGECTERRPLAYMDDWFVGMGARRPPGDAARPEMRRIYTACCLEWSMRQQIKADDARRVLLATSATDSGLRRRWRVRVDTAIFRNPEEVMALQWFTMPRGTIIRSHKADNGVCEFILDIPADEEVTPRSPRVRAEVVGFGLVEGATEQPPSFGDAK